MRRHKEKILATLMAFIVVCTTVQFPARAASPEFPEFTTAADSFGSINGLIQNEKELLIKTTASGKDITLSLTFPTGGGIRLCDSDSEGTNKMFVPESVTKISYKDNPTQLIATGENGNTVVLNYSKSVWELSVKKSEDNTDIYLLKADDLKTSYDAGIRASVGLQGRIASDEKFIGLGERYSGVILNGKSYNLWNTDNWSEGTDSYVNVPLLHSNKGYSLFFNSFYGCKANIGETDNSKYTLDFAGPDIDFYIWTGTPLENLKSYLALTGTTATIPEWATHYWSGGATQWYWESQDGTKDSIAVYREMLEKYRALGTMPTAVFGEASLLRHEEAYNLCKQYGVKMLGWYHPDQAMLDGLYRKYNSDFLESRFYYKSDSLKPAIRKLSDPSQFFTYKNGDVTNWVQIDYTHEKAVDLIWRNLKDYTNKEKYGEYGLSGLMVDYGEYIETDMLFANGLSGDEMHNLQAYYYNKAMKEAWETTLEKKEDYVLFARAGCAGSQNFAAQFGGDQRSNFDGLKKAVMGGISASASGFSIWGSDIGGLSPKRAADGSYPNITKECYLRWLGYGTFSPLMRAHGWPDHNPWAFDSERETSAQDAFKKYYWLRENLADMIYSATLQSNADGMPVMQSMAMAFPEDKKLFEIEDQYLFCNEILVCPVYAEGVTSKKVTLPEGTWYNLWNGNKITSKGSETTVEAPIDQIPAFIRSGTVIPMDISSKTLKLMDSMENGNTTQVLYVTPNEIGKSRTATWFYDNKTLEYESSTDAGATTIAAKQGSNPKIILAYDVLAEKVVIDGEELPELSAKPFGAQVGYYIDEASNQTYIAVPSKNWRSVEIVTDEKDAVADYAFNVSAKQNTQYLDKAFDAYKFNAPKDEAGTKAAVGPAAPSEKDSDYKEGDVSYFTTQYHGTNTRGYLKPGNVYSGGFNTLTYKRNNFTDFEAEYEMFGTWSIFGIAFGGKAGVFPISKDNNAENDSGVVVYMENDGCINIGGTIDSASVKTTGGITAKVSGQGNLAGVVNIRTSSVTDKSLSVTAYPNDETDTHIVCVKVKNQILTVWEKSNPYKKVSIRLTDNYKGGTVSLIANQTNHGAFKSFRITSLDSSLTYRYDFENLSDVSELDNTFAAYNMSNTGGNKVSGMVSEYWTRSTMLDGGCANKPYLKALHRGNANQYTALSYTKAQVYDFDAAVEIANNYTQYGVLVAPAEEIYSLNHGIKVFAESSGKIHITGAIDSDTAKGEGTTLTKKINDVVTGDISGFKKVANGESQNTIYTLQVTVKSGLLTVSVKEYPEIKVTVNMSNAYEGGVFSLYTAGNNQGGFKTLNLNVPAIDTVVLEKERLGNEVTYTVQTTEKYGSISAQVDYDSSLYTDVKAVEADGVTADVRQTNGSVQLYLFATESVHSGEWITLKFTMSEPQKKALSVKARTMTADGGGRRVKTMQVFLGDVNDDNERNSLDLVRLKKYESSCKEEFATYRFQLNGTGVETGNASKYWNIGKEISSDGNTYKYNAAYLRPTHRATGEQVTYLTYGKENVEAFTAKVAIANNYTQYGVAIAPIGEKQSAGNGIIVYVQGEGNIHIAGAVNVQTVTGTGTTVVQKPNEVYTGAIADFRKPDNNQCSSTVYTLNVEVKNGIVTAKIEEYPSMEISVETNSNYKGGAFSLYSTGCNQGGFKSFELNYVSKEETLVSISQNFEALGGAVRLDTVIVQRENSKMNIAVDIDSKKNTALLRKKLADIVQK